MECVLCSVTRYLSLLGLEQFMSVFLWELLRVLLSHKYPDLNDKLCSCPKYVASVTD